MPEKKLKVRIYASQTVIYDQVVEMTRDEWENMKACDEDDIGEEAGGWLDLRDVSDGDEMEIMQLVVVDDAGKPVKPLDEYVG